jgi:hypothetical protein
VDDSTLRQLRESNYYHPEITEVIFDPKIMLTMASDSAKFVQVGYDMLWDTIMSEFISKYYVDGTRFVEQQAKEKGIKLRLIVEITTNNKDFINSLEYHEIRHLDGIRSNIGIFDNRAYMVAIFHKESIQPDQIFFSNSKTLVKQQRHLFDSLWDIAIPLSARNKELEYQQDSHYQKTLTNPEDIKREINDVIQQCRKELLIISSTKLLNHLYLSNDFLLQISDLLKRGVYVRILSNVLDTDIKTKFSFVDSLGLKSRIEYEVSNQLNRFNESILIADGKSMLRSIFDPSNDLVAYISTNESSILVEEILFEKYWNEIKSLELINDN